MTLRFGILGTGKIATLFAAALRDSTVVSVAAVASRDAGRAAAFAREHAVPGAYGDYAELVGAPEVDAVYVALPHPLHAAWSIAAAEAGKHVLCEKPLAMSAGEAGDVVAAVRRAGVAMMEAFAYRFHPVTARAVELIGSATIGTPRMIDATFGYNAGQADNYLFRADLGGGSILDVGCYTMSLARRLAGAAGGRPFADPDRVEGVAHVGKDGVDHAASASLLFADGLVARLGCAVTADLPDAAVVHGDSGSLRINSPWLPGRLGTVSIDLTIGGTRTTETIASPRPLYALEAEAFATVLEHGEHPAMTWADSVGNAAALDAWRSTVTTPGSR